MLPMPRVLRSRTLFRSLTATVLAASLISASWSVKAEAFEHAIRALIADESVPGCEQSSVIETIRSKFGDADAAILKSGLSIAAVDHIKETYAGINDPRHYLHRYCEAHVQLSNGKTPVVYYLVEQEAGFSGITWNVEFCVAGYEPWHIHDGNCHAVRHHWW